MQVSQPPDSDSREGIAVLPACDKWAVESQGDGGESPQSLPQGYAPSAPSSNAGDSGQPNIRSSLKHGGGLGVSVGVSLCGVRRGHCLAAQIRAWMTGFGIKSVRVMEGTLTLNQTI